MGSSFQESWEISWARILLSRGKNKREGIKKGLRRD
jgi:hypothetical protein